MSMSCIGYFESSFAMIEQFSHQLLFHAWYLDDGTIIGDTKEVAKAIDIIRAEGPRLGLELNIKKTKVFWPSCNGVKVKEGLFPRDIGRPTLDVKLLGGAVSRDAGFISSLVVKRASRAVELLSLRPPLWNPSSFCSAHAWASQSCCLVSERANLCR
ncbi:hypothetical protein Tco_0225866, partial [Tanacetum coccineum]